MDFYLVLKIRKIQPIIVFQDATIVLLCSPKIRLSGKNLVFYVPPLQTGEFGPWIL